VAAVCQGQPVPGCGGAHHCGRLPRRLISRHDRSLGSLVTPARDHQVGSHHDLIYNPYHHLLQHNFKKYLHHYSRSVTWGAWSPPLETTK
jgi:hypothetical protein